jgi:hypothetical protein
MRPNQILKMMMLELHDTVRGIVPSSILRHLIGLGALLVSSAMGFFLLYATLTEAEFTKNLIRIDKLNGVLLFLFGIALFTTLLGAAHHLEHPAQSRMALLSPWVESRQLLPKVLSLLIISVSPFALFVSPFVLPVAFKNPELALTLLVRTACIFMWSFLFSNCTVVVLAKNFGREKGSKSAFMISVLATATLLLFGSHLFFVQISSKLVYQFVVASLIACPLAIALVLGQFRNVLLSSQDHLLSKEPHWGTYPWFQLFKRGRAPWIVLIMIVSPLTVLINPGGSAFIWKSISLSLTTIPLAYIINDLLSWDRANPKLWLLAPRQSFAMRQLVMRQALPIMLVSFAVAIALGVTFNKINWLAATVCLIPLQIPILHFSSGRAFTFITTTFSVIFILFNPIFN